MEINIRNLSISQKDNLDSIIAPLKGPWARAKVLKIVNQNDEVTPI